MLTEDDLRTRLHALADPIAGASDPVAGVRDRIRVLRRRRTAVTVTLAVVVVLVLGLVTGYGPLKPHHPAPVPGSTASPTPSALPPAKAPDLTHLRSAQQVWPGAVRLLPDKLTGGRGYDVYGALGDGRYLISIAAGFDLTGDVAILDTRHDNALTMLSVASAGQGASEYQPQQPVLTADGVAWVTNAERNGQWTTEIWASDLTARSARLLTTLPAHAVPTPALAWVVGDRVLYQGNSDGGGPTYWVPRSGGQPRRIDGTAGYYPLTGAWTSTVRAIGSTSAGEDSGSGLQMFNVLTGARIPIQPNPATWDKPLDGPPLNTLSCTPDWCVGYATDARNYRSLAVQHPDGSGYLEVGSASTNTVFGDGRFVVGYRDLGNDRVQDFIWDEVTGTAGSFGAPANSNGHLMQFVADPAQNCYTWAGSGGKLVLDTTAFG